MKRRSCLALPAVLALPAAVGAAPAERALMGFTENLAPLNYQDGAEVKGFSVELLRKMASAAGLALDLQVLPWQRALQMAEAQPASVLFSLTRTPERESQFQWVGPIAPRRVLVYRLAKRTDLSLPQLSELRERRIGVVRDSAADRLLQAAGLRPGVELEHGLDDATNVRKLLASRMEFVVLLDWAAAWAMRQHKLDYEALQPVMELDVTRAYWYGLRPDADPAVARRLQAALEAMKRDGRYEQLRQRYFR